MLRLYSRLSRTSILYTEHKSNQEVQQTYEQKRERINVTFHTNRPDEVVIIYYT